VLDFVLNMGRLVAHLALPGFQEVALFRLGGRLVPNDNQRTFMVMKSGNFLEEAGIIKLVGQPNRITIDAIDPFNTVRLGVTSRSADFRMI
jgi:hypothetical protein